MKSSIVVALIIGLVVIIIAAMFLSETGSKETITSRGNSVIKAEADRVGIYLEVSTLADTAVASKDLNAEISQRLLNDLKLVLGQENIETINFNVYEEFDWTGDGRKSNGFRTMNNLKIATDRFDIVGKLVDLSIEDGARVSYINFELSEEKRNELKKQVLEEASQDAREKAEAVASGLGQKVGKVVSVSTDNYDYMPYRFLEAAATTESVQLKADTEILHQDLEVRADVNVVFEIKGGLLL